MRDSKGRFIDGWSGKRNRPKGLKYKIVNQNRASFKKGMTPWNKGITHSKETREKISKANKGTIAWNKGKLGLAGKDHPNWKGGISFDGKYLKVNIGRNKTKRVHRKVMEEYLDRNLSFNECVHHINGNKLDNRLENLQVLSRVEHTKIHKYD